MEIPSSPVKMVGLWHWLYHWLVVLDDLSRRENIHETWRPVLLRNAGGEVLQAVLAETRSKATGHGKCLQEKPCSKGIRISNQALSLSILKSWILFWVIRILCGPLHFAKPSSQPNSADIRNSVGDPTQHVQNCPQSFPLLSLKSFSKPILQTMVFNMFNKEISISGSPVDPHGSPPGCSLASFNALPVALISGPKASRVDH